MRFHCAGIEIDASRQSDSVLSYAHSSMPSMRDRVAQWIAGAPINDTENQPAMHMALRVQDNSLFPSRFVDPVLAERERQKSFVENCSIKDFIHIGVGGSILGPHCVVESLRGYAAPQKRVSFLSTLTPEMIERVALSCNPNESLCLVGSKSFATAEIKYITDRLSDTFGWPQDRFIALTAAPERARASGIGPDNILPFWSWVGGRYSVWSSIGLPIALSYGWIAFEEFLAGAREVDRVTCTDFESSVAFKLATLLHAKRHISGTMGLAVLPYHADLHLLPAYLQQLMMESNGKPTPDGCAAPIIFGATGTEFQHSFGQYLHQGPDVTNTLFITVANARQASGWQAEARDIMNANALAQADTLWYGRADPLPHKVITGERSSIILTLPALSPYTMGALLALLEYVTVFDGFLSGVNPFDQWGVEAGKKLVQERLKNGS